MSPDTIDGSALITEFLKHSPFARLVDLELVDLAPDRAELRLRFRAEVTTAGEVVHGGAISTLIDTAATAAAWATEFDQTPTRWGTASLSVDFLRPAQGRDLSATATVTRRGHQLCFCDVDVSDGSNTIARGLVTYALS
jgi:uncharacterized protein (TIGR00369 family)